MFFVRMNDFDLLLNSNVLEHMDVRYTELSV